MKSKTGALGAPKRMRLRLDQLKTDPMTFQFRDFETREDHVRDLAEVVARGGTLDPLVVWERAENDFVVVDGHHRHAAYELQKYAKGIPVVVHKVEEAEAHLLALKDNTKAKLPMTKDERQNAAWRLVCSEHRFSKAQTVKATGVSDGTVAKMRRTLKALCKADDAIPAKWWKAMVLLKGHETCEWDDDMRDQAIQARANQLESAIGDELGRMSGVQWEAVAEVLQRRIEKVTLGYIVDYLSPCEVELEDCPF